MRTLTLAGLMLFAVGVVPQLAAQQDSSVPGKVKWQCLIVPTRELNPTLLENRFRQMLAAKPSQVQVMRVIVMDREESSMLDAKGFTDVTYGLWQTLFSDYEKGIPPFAELLVVGNNASMRVRDPEGRVSVKVLAGDDSFTFEGCGTRFDVAHVSVAETNRSINSSDVSSHVHFFLVTQGRIGESETRCILDQLRASISASTIGVSVRNDPWFIRDDDFPVVSPFLTDLHPPTKERYESSPESVCIFSGKGPNCWGH